MVNDAWIGIGMILVSNIIAGFSQILLKQSAKKEYTIWWKSYINPKVITGYALLLGTTVFGVLALRFIPLSVSAAFAASGQIIVPALSAIFLKEKISKRKRTGMAIIVIGIVVFSI
jgi:drug/metabolite transporter (DMT)-like permease